MNAAELEGAYARSDRGQSVRSLDLSWLSPQQVHSLLVTKGFRGVAVPLTGSRGRGGERRYPLVDRSLSADAKDPRRAFEHVYEHPDGGIVRLFPSGTSCFGLGLREAAVRKSVLARRPIVAQDYGVATEAFAVSADGMPVPKTPRALHGGPTGTPMRARRRALDGIHAARTKLAPGAAVPLVVVEQGIGLLASRTIVRRGISTK